jgi:acetyl esterase/lipase
MTRHALSVSGLFAAAVLAVVLCFDGARAIQPNFNNLLTGPQPTPGKRLAYGKDPNQFGDLFLPDGPGPYPVVALVHGGCWSASLPGVALVTYLAEDLRKSGVAVWSIEYRRLGDPGGGYPGTFLDIADGMDYLRALADVYNLDISNVVALGHSAGGHLALWAAARGHIKPASALYSANPLPIQAVVTLAGVDDLKDFYDNDKKICGGPSIITDLINPRGRPGQDPYADTSPAAMLPLHVDQVVVAGTLDTIVPEKFASDYVALAKAAGDPVTMMEMEGAGHLDLINPGSDAWKQVKPVLLSYIHLNK